MTDAVFYQTMVDVAQQLLTQFGELGALRKVQPAASDTPWAPPSATYADLPCNAAWVPIGTRGPFARQTAKGTDVPAGFFNVYVCAADLPAGTEITMADLFVRADGSVFSIDTVDPLNPAGQTIFWQLRAKQ